MTATAIGNKCNLFSIAYPPPINPDSFVMPIITEHEQIDDKKCRKGAHPVPALADDLGCPHQNRRGMVDD
jgi:hypothetical protein